MAEGSGREPTLARRGMQALIEPPDEPTVERTARGDATLVEQPPVTTAAAVTPHLRAPELYLDRELTRLEFNRRVLHEAQDSRNPLLKRVR